MSALLQAVDVLNQRLILAHSIGQAFQAVAGGADAEAPPWVDVYRGQVEAIMEAADVLECLVRGGGS